MPKKKLAVLVAAGVAVAIACSVPTAAQATTSAFGPAATAQTAAASQRAAFDPTKAPTVTDLGANGGGNSARGIRVSGQAVDDTDFVVLVNGVQSLRLQPGKDGSAIGTVKTGLRQGTNVIEVRQVLMWTGSQSTPYGSVSYTYGADQADEAWDASRAPKVVSTDVYNDQGRAALVLDGIAHAGAEFVATVNGRSSTAAVRNGGNGTVVVDGLRPGVNTVSVVERADGQITTAATEHSVTRLATPTASAVQAGAEAAIVSVSTSEAGEVVLRDRLGEEVARATSAGTKSRESVQLVVPAAAPKELALTVERAGAVSDPTVVSIPDAGDQTGTRPLVVTSDDRFDPDTAKVLTGTATPGAEVFVSVPAKPFETTVEADADGTWSATLPVLTGALYPATLVAQYVDGDLVDLETFDLVQDPDHSPLEVDVQDRSATSVRLGVTNDRPGTFTVSNGDEQLAEGAVHGNETVPVDVPLSADAATLTVRFATADGTVTTKTVDVQAFDEDAAYLPATLTSETSYRTGDEVVLSGAGTPGATIDASVPGHGFERSTTVGADGTWSITVGYLHAGGFDGNTIVQTVGAETNTIRFSLTSAVEFTAPAADSTVEQARPTFAGTGQADDTVTVRDAEGRTIATTTVRPDGSWSVGSSVDLPNGIHTATVEQAPAS